MSEINVEEDNEKYTIRYWKYSVLILKNLFYSKESHFWIKQQGDIVEIGYSDPFQRLMGDIAAISLPPKGSATEEMGEIESMKAATEIISPVEGTFIDVNEELEKEPYLVNEKPYSSWLFRVKPSNLEESKKYLQSASEYLKEVLKIIEAQEAKRK